MRLLRTNAWQGITRSGRCMWRTNPLPGTGLVPFAPAPSTHLPNLFLGPLLSGGFIDCAGRGVVESDSISSLVV